MFSIIFAALFGLSLLPGRKPLCLRVAERLSGGIMPKGTVAYCRRLTWIWFVILLGCIAMGGGLSMAFGLHGMVASVVLTPMVMATTFLVEGCIRRRRFSVAFRTSGSTSQPKTIVKTFESLAKEVSFHRSRLSIDADTVFLSTVEPDHMYGMLWRVMLPASTAGRIDPEIILTPESLITKMDAAKKVFFVTTPSFLKRFCAYAEQYDVPQNCVEIITSGALLDAETSAATKRVFGVAPLEIFGSTETGGVAWRRQGGSRCRTLGDRVLPQGDESRVSYDWTVFDPVKVKVDAEGRLVVRSPFSFQRNFVMGDGVELAPDRRHFKLLGRRDRLVKIAEQRVSLPEMEEKMKQLDGIDDVALVALEGERGTYLGAVVVLDATRDVATSVTMGAKILALRKRLIPIFPKGSVPKRYRFVSELPRNAQGKVQVSALRDLMARGADKTVV